MKKAGWIILAVVVILIISLYGWVKGTYNNLVTMDGEVEGARAQVENQYQRRADLVPNLVQVVEGYADQEFTTLTAVTEARAKATSTTVDISNAEDMAAFQEAQGELSSALSRLLVSVEAYPDLKSDALFENLQVQLEGTENRITTERGRYNETAKNYNILIRTFPTNIIAGIFNFDGAQLFEAENGAEVAPDVDFDFSDRNTEDIVDVIDTTNTQIDDAIDVIDTTTAN